MARIPVGLMRSDAGAAVQVKARPVFSLV